MVDKADLMMVWDRLLIFPECPEPDVYVISKVLINPLIVKVSALISSFSYIRSRKFDLRRYPSHAQIMLDAYNPDG